MPTARHSVSKQDKEVSTVPLPMPFVSNARMYAVSPEAEATWKDLIARVAEDAGTADPGHLDAVMCCVKRIEL